MLCILAVFVSSFFMQGAARSLFVPLSLAVGFAMMASYLLSSTFVPVLSVWLLKAKPRVSETQTQPDACFDRLRGRYREFADSNHVLALVDCRDVSTLAQRC